MRPPFRNFQMPKYRLKVIVMKEAPTNTTSLSERGERIAPRRILSLSAFRPDASPRSVTGKRGLWIPGTMKKPGRRTEGPTPSSCPNNNARDVLPNTRPVSDFREEVRQKISDPHGEQKWATD